LPDENGQPAALILIPPWLCPGLRVRLSMPDNPRVHNAIGVVAEVTGYVRRTGPDEGLLTNFRIGGLS
jgi:hypothetical protein